jgi:hypothetical protein
MSIRESDIAERVAEWMDRFAVPSHLSDKPQAAQKEAEAILRIVLKYAPRHDYVPFLNRVFDQIDYQKKSRVWPTPHELGAVCANVTKDMPKNGQTASSVNVDFSSEAVMGRRMERGEAVGEDWLYGRLAVELIVNGLVTEPVMRSYRSSAFLARKEIYGEEAALQWETEAKARHEIAKQLHRERNEPRRKYETDFTVNRVQAVG